MPDVISWLKGDLSSAGRIWSALGPALFLGSYFLVGLVIYGVRLLLKGRYRDAEIEGRAFILGGGARAYFAWIMSPLWRGFMKLQVPPNAVTTLSVLLACAAGVSVAMGRFSLGGWLYLFAGACDFIDGRLARVTGQASKAGAAFDSVLDRYCESAVLVGLAWFYRDSWVLLAVLATLVGSFLVPYIRARGEGLGVEVKMGLMQRPERLVLMGVTMAFSPIVEALLNPSDPRPPHTLAVLALVLLAVTTQFTAVTRLLFVMRALGKDYVGETMKSRGQMIRSVISAGVATATDFGAVLMFVSVMNLDPWVATALGCLIGGAVNFAMNRAWTFGSTGAPLGQASRYLFVSMSSALLNSGGVAVLLFVPALDYRIAWLIARAAVFVAWNYPLQRDYVFAEGQDEVEANEPTVA
jgi:phosphatidylglycerophosphate synthase/putative flippase GtrA